MKTKLLFMQLTFAFICLSSLIATTLYYFGGDTEAHQDSLYVAIASLVGGITFAVIDKLWIKK